MKSETLIYGIEILVMLDENENISFEGLEKISKIKGDELRELLNYLKKKEYLLWKMPFIFGTIESGVKVLDKDKIKLDHKGMEVVLGKRDYFEEIGISQTIHNETNINGDQNQVAQTTGDNSSITQTQDNSKITVLREMIKEDKELDEPKKKKLFGLLEKFNTLKQSGENAYELIKQVGLIAIKYVPLFFALLHH